MNHYTVRFQPWDGSWLLAGPVGANGGLLFKSARDAASYARLNARQHGGKIEVFDPSGKPYRTIRIELDPLAGSEYVLPSV